ncbi:MAG TPA: hypothetical protein VEJ46_04820 [Candidatus Acidoferrum sp.]|nr:hypothetical protein [Candidatus Acidoferrum sp.]
MRYPSPEHLLSELATRGTSGTREKALRLLGMNLPPTLGPYKRKSRESLLRRLACDRRKSAKARLEALADLLNAECPEQIDGDRETLAIRKPDPKLAAMLDELLTGSGVSRLSDVNDLSMEHFARKYDTDDIALLNELRDAASSIQFWQGYFAHDTSSPAATLVPFLYGADNTEAELRKIGEAEVAEARKKLTQHNIPQSLW